MTPTVNVSGRVSGPPRAAAMAGIIFSVFMVLSLGIVRLAVPADPANASRWLADPTRHEAIEIALQLVPFAGIAFLWFMGVLRHCLGEREDRFFATVFLGSGLIFVASLFGATVMAGSLLEDAASANGHPGSSENYHFIRYATHAFLNIFAIKMAAVFTFSTCTIALRTGIFPRWIAYTGFASGLVLLLVITTWPWIALIFPLWMLVVSTQVLLADLRRAS